MDTFTLQTTAGNLATICEHESHTFADPNGKVWRGTVYVLKGSPVADLQRRGKTIHRADLASNYWRKWEKCTVRAEARKCLN